MRQANQIERLRDISIGLTEIADQISSRSPSRIALRHHTDRLRELAGFLEKVARAGDPNSKICVVDLQAILNGSTLFCEDLALGIEGLGPQRDSLKNGVDLKLLKLLKVTKELLVSLRSNQKEELSLVIQAVSKVKELLRSLLVYYLRYFGS